jgi:hypothetical protein
VHELGERRDWHADSANTVIEFFEDLDSQFLDTTTM